MQNTVSFIKRNDYRATTRISHTLNSQGIAADPPKKATLYSHLTKIRIRKKLKQKLVKSKPTLAMAI